MYRYSDPVRDAEAYYYDQERKQKAWEDEHYRGLCPYCGKPMYEDAYDTGENYVYDEDHDLYCHEWCRYLAQEEEEAFDDMMEHPMEELERLVTI